MSNESLYTVHLYNLYRRKERKKEEKQLISSMNRDNGPLQYTDKSVELEEQPADVPDFQKITHHLRGIHGIYLQLMKEKTPKVHNMEVVGLGKY